MQNNVDNAAKKTTEEDEYLNANDEENNLAISASNEFNK